LTGASQATWGSPLNLHSGGGTDVFVLKLNSSGAYQWHTFYGSSNNDAGYAIAADAGGNIYLTGSSYAVGVPLNAHSGSLDIFVFKLDGSGEYQWHTFYGSSSGDAGQDIALDGNGNIHVAGYSLSTWGSPIDAYVGNVDIAVLKLNADTVMSCTYTLSSSADSFTSSSAQGSVALTPSNSSCSWTAVSNDAWITLTAGAAGTGTGTVSYSIAVNASESSRTGTIAIAGQTFTVTQSGAAPVCTFTLSSTAVSLSNSSATGGVTVTPSSSICPWTAGSSDSWITVTAGSTGTGTGIVTYSVSANTAASGRTGTINVAGQTFTVIQEDTAPSMDTVQKAYIGYYQRPADPAGQIWWADYLATHGGSLAAIIEAFANSDESRALYGEINSGNIAAVIDAIYQALFNRQADAAGRDWYVTEFNKGAFTAATIMLNVLYGAQNDDLVTLNNKLITANLFTKTIDPELDSSNFLATYAGDTDAVAARSFLGLVSSAASSVPTQSRITEYIKSYIADPGDAILTP